MGTSAKRRPKVQPSTLVLPTQSFKVIVHLFQVVVLSFAPMPTWVLVAQCAF
ncbi:hypothetical protein PO909_018678 [Leuciscus waleckii]